MTKKFLYLAMVAFATTAFVACGSDDDDTPDTPSTKPVTIQKAPMAEKAGKYVLSSSTPVTNEATGLQLNSVEIMDGGQVSFELRNPHTGKVEVVTADVEMRENHGYVKTNPNNRVEGDFELEAPGTKAIQANGIKLNIKIDGAPYITVEGTPAECVLQATVASQGNVLSYVAQKFKVTGMMIDLKGDVKAYKELSSANLYEIAKIAQDNGANLTDEEMKSFNKVISYVTVSSYGTISIVYSDGKCDSGSWNWLNNQADKMSLYLKDKGMGNKFIPENTTIDLSFSGNQCAMKIHAKITGSKNYDASLTLIMDAQK